MDSKLKVMWYGQKPIDRGRTSTQRTKDTQEKDKSIHYVSCQTDIGTSGKRTKSDRTKSPKYTWYRKSQDQKSQIWMGYNVTGQK
ncbi:hypothetical protein CHS0354_036385 [Potamilus streckersoni]|uniref:Uncharacterized protein n=1 Tax=Potamilus streckersoni TaxID=2493646 RepID=A0AAE0SXG5_9BIVA|nr:hypothetical protein CHS0354_036385 [Potamilus streckersoni]